MNSKQFDNLKIRDLRSFGLIWSIFLILISLFPVLKGHHIRYWPIPFSVLFLIISFYTPKILSKFYVIWVKFGNLIGNVISKIVLFIIFYLLITPIGLILRISGKDLLNKKMDKGLTTYWIKRVTQPTSLKNQF
jgi:hypothetical protein